MKQTKNKGQKLSSKDLIEKFRFLLQDSSVLTISTREFEPPSASSNTVALSYDPQLFSEMVAAIQQICPKVSRKTIEQEIHQSFIRLFEQQDSSKNNDFETQMRYRKLGGIVEEATIEPELNNLIDLLKTKVKLYTAYVPLTGLILKIPSLEIGDITIYPNDIGPLSDTIKNSRSLTANEKEYFSQKGCYAAVSNIEGDKRYTQEEESIRDRVDPIVDVLSLYLASSNHRREGFAKITIGKHHASTLEVYTISESESLSASKKLSAYKLYEVDADIFRGWKDYGFDEIVRCRLSNTKNSLEARIKHAIIWYSKGVNSDGKEEQFVALTTALESLLVGQEGTDIRNQWGSITQRLADRVAFLLPRNNYEARINLSQEVKDLYRLRSLAVHEGEQIPEKELDRMNSLVRGVILTFVDKKVNNIFSSWEQFQEWMKKQIYSTPDSFTKS